MRLNKLFSIVVTFLLFSSVFLIVSPVHAEEGIDNDIEADFTVQMDSATDFRLTVEIQVNKIKLTGSDTVYTGSEIETISGSNQMMLGAIAQELKVLLTSTVRNTFLNADVTALNVLPSYENQKFNDEYTVNLTADFFDVNNTINVHNLVNGLLDNGAFLIYNVDFQAEKGWNNTYTFNLGKTYNYKRTNGFVSGNTVKWYVQNGMGYQPTTNGELTIFDNHPTSSASAPENIFLEFILDSTTGETSFTSNIIIRTANITIYNVLPSFIGNLSNISADSIRLLIENGLIASWDEFYQKTIQPIQETITTTIETPRFNQTLNLGFTYDTTTTNLTTPYKVNSMDTSPPIKAILTDNEINLKLLGVTSQALFGLVNAGGIANVSEENINIGENLKNIGYSYNITLKMPEDITLKNKNVYTWDNTVMFSGDFVSNNAPKYKNEEKNTIIEIEITNTDLNLLSFLTGKTELSFGTSLQETRNYNVTTPPSQFNIPKKIILNYLNSDALRLCIQEEVFTKEQVNMFLEDEKKIFETRMTNLLPELEITGTINRGLFESSLVWDEDINNMDKNTPVTTNSYAKCTYPVHFDLSIIPPGFSIPTQTYNFTGLKNQSVTYRIIFPHGIDIQVSDLQGKAKVKKTDDDRKYLEISFTTSEDNLTVDVSCKMIPSALFVIGIFTPCIISLIITIILITVIIMLRKKRKTRKTGIPPTTMEPEEPTGYEGEDYYIPPPPGSK